MNEKDFKMNKKGNIQQLFPAVLAIVLTGALMCIGILILSSFQSTTYATGTTGISSNESLAVATTSGITLTTGNALRDGVCGALTKVYNGTASVAIGLGNFTQTGCLVTNVTQTFDTAGYTANFRYNYPYTYSADTTISTAIGSTNTSLATLASTWLPIIVVVLAAGIVLSILLGAFAGKRK